MFVPVVPEIFIVRGRENGTDAHRVEERFQMRKWVEEDWEFTVTVFKGEAEQCRLGFEQGDSFTCEYEVPAGFCPKTMPVLYTLCEIIRCGGSFKARGSDQDYEICFNCADGPVSFRLEARHIGIK